MSISLIRLNPDADAFALWAAQHRFLARTGSDVGYALHAALKSTLGDLAPRPFYWRTRSPQEVELLGYVRASANEFVEAAAIANADPTLRKALGLDSFDSRDMPLTWRQGRRLSFECRVRPVVRQHEAEAIDGKRPNRVKEVDAADHAWRVNAEQGISEQERPSKEDAYCQWIASELARGGASESSQIEIKSMRRSIVLRRPETESGRNAVSVDGPDVTARGELTVRDGAAFADLLARGLGRHRAFGFGMLLVGPSGALA